MYICPKCAALHHTLLHYTCCPSPQPHARSRAAPRATPGCRRPRRAARRRAACAAESAPRGTRAAESPAGTAQGCEARSRGGAGAARGGGGGKEGVARGGHARGTRLQLRVERLEQPAAQPRVLSDERDELGRGAALRLAVDVEAAPFVTLLDVAAGQVDAEHALLALGGDRVRRDLW
jgi:hypothetical protein